MKSPIEKLTLLINPDLCYGVTEIWLKCKHAGFNFSVDKIKTDIQRGKLETYQVGKHSDHHIQGDIFLDYIVKNSVNDS
jgi:hypothetical protein